MGTIAMSRRGRPASGCGGRAWYQARAMRSMLVSFMSLIGTDESARPYRYRFARPVTRSRSGSRRVAKPAANAVVSPPPPTMSDGHVAASAG